MNLQARPHEFAPDHLAQPLEDRQRQSLADDPPRVEGLGAIIIEDRSCILPAAQMLSRLVQECGLRIMLWHDLATLAPTVDEDGQSLNTAVFGWSTAELDPWECSDKALRSPVVRACRVEGNPFWINSQAIHILQANPLVEQISPGDFEKRTGLSAAIVVPVHLPFAQIGMALLSGVHADESNLACAFRRDAERLAAPIRSFVSGYVLAHQDFRLFPPDTLLTPREIECLRWAAQGKTDIEIGIILGCSHAGVRYHITRSSRKLGAATRAQSVFRAAQLGYLSAEWEPSRGPVRPRQ